jgi:cyclopropane-fatty-acyl-phospholipid synthase
VPFSLPQHVLSAILRRLSGARVTVRHLDGTVEKFGNGDPFFTIVIRNERAYRRLLWNPSMSLGECYMDGDIDFEGDMGMLSRLAVSTVENIPATAVLRSLRAPFRNAKRVERKNIQHHYDIGNDFYKMWLDDSMTYTCAYFHSETDSLETAQRNKREHIHRKLNLQPGQRVLEIGSGWGTALVEAAERYGVSGVGVTLSDEQLRHSQALAAERGMSDKVEFRLQNYRDITGEQFDAVYSIGMYEAVGRHNAKLYFGKINELLVDGGISVLHTITRQRPEGNQPWINKYIFPGGYIPAGSEVVQAFAANNFRLVHSENLRMHYATTLDEWSKRFFEHREEVVDMFDERFARMWEYYLRGAAGSFRYGWLDLFQYTFTKGTADKRPRTNAYMYDGISTTT